MKHLIIVLAVFVGITTVSFSLGQVKRPQAELAPDALMSDYDKIEKLRLEVAELQSKLAALNQKYDAHTHRLRLGITRFPRLINCDVKNAYVDKICRQFGDDSVSVTTAGSMQAMVTAPPGP